MVVMAELIDRHDIEDHVVAPPSLAEGWVVDEFK